MAVQDNKNQNPLDMLYQIVNDLWAKDVRTAQKMNETLRTTSPVPQPVGAASVPTPAPARPAPQKAPAPPPFEEFWRRADERIDWTEVLLRTTPNDGITTAAQWTFLHERAERVLSGDLAAYAEVLQERNPLADLAPYAGHVTVSAPTPDQAQVSFAALENTVEPQRLLSGLALRCARDVLALLPVREVQVHGEHPDGTTMDVTYPYDSLRKAQFGYIDPVAYAEELGCTFGKAPEDPAEEA